MYEAFFGLNRRGFGPAPDTGCVADVQTMRDALDDLRQCVENGGEIGVLTAPPGLGKTLLCRKLIEDLQDSYETVLLPNSNLATRRSLLQAMLYELGQPYTRMAEQELRLEFTSAVRQIRPGREALLLVIDEAHVLNERLLEEIRTATNLVEDGVPLVRVVLSGQPALEEKLLQPALDALNQRIRAQVMLEPLTRRESAEYIAQRLQWAGAGVDRVLTPEALELICHCADGVPRCLNQLCDHSLCLAAAAQTCPVDAATVHAALEELKRLPLHWNDPGAIGTASSEAMGSIEISRAAEQGDGIAEPAEDDEPIEALPSAGSIEVGAALPEATGDEIETDLMVDAVEPASLIEFGCEDQTAPPLATVQLQQPHQAEGTEFEEEVVIDRYAMLDAGYGNFSEIAADQGPAKHPAMPEWHSTADDEPEEAKDPDWLPDLTQTAEENGLDEEELEAWRELRPDEAIDEIVPLLDIALDTSDYTEPAAENPHSGHQVVHEPGWPLPQRDDDSTFEKVVFDEQPRAESFEAHSVQLGPDAAEDDGGETFVHRVEFDIVLPEESDLHQETAEIPPAAREPDPAHAPAQPRHYRRLFSELRRRQRQEG